MTDSRPGAPAIGVSGLWQVFGEGAKPALAEGLENSAATSDGVAHSLRDAGLIPAVQHATFEVGSGELFVIMGLSGSGKSTLVRCISRLVEPTAGKVELFGEDILTANKKRMTELRRDKLGMVFQHFGLFPHMSVRDNVAFPLKMKGVATAARRKRAEEVIRLVGLDGREDSYPRELSGGQRQRVGIARSLAVNPDVWFLDEPFSALDPLIRRQLQDEFLNIQATLKKSIVFITHDIAEALKLADRIAIMRDGAIVQIGTPTEIVLNPVDSYVAEFSRDIPRGQHMTLDALMERIEPHDGMGSGPVLRASMTLNDALSACARTFEPIPVRDGDGKVVGVIDPDRLARAVGEAQA
ncbi:MAG: betaine/proline/choline family ABC transporter ATP-binding protein [Pseudomonadota bacterium]